MRSSRSSQDAVTELRCECGEVRGQVHGVAPETVNHCICYCADCRDFLHHLGRDTWLEPGGGVRIVQVAPARVTVTAGRERIACLRLSAKGLLRSYAACCSSPLGNALSSAWPFVGLSGRALAANHDELGRAVGINGKSALAGAPAGTAATIPLATAARLARLLAGWKLRGLARPAPFFTDAGAPIAPPTVLTPKERTALRVR
jgi:hypothetical protein